MFEEVSLSIKQLAQYRSVLVKVSYDAKQTKMRLRQTHRGTQFGDVLSTSQVANNFIGTGL